MKFYKITGEDEELIKIALETLQRNFDDGIYHHTVGAALRCQSGKIYSGVNCDGIHGSCAEYITIGMAISAGEKDFDTIVAVHDNAPNFLVPPCGNCRQLLIEYCPNIQVILNDENNNVVKADIKDLLPLAWKPVAM
ncbi:MAG TPA: cytidine deaminase [Candidatus Fimenecus excrementigallinarum]|uniref:Cytidine deaminase n=1 Tax=Candidatus Fimenecus excrementigallinarum TaxID=2840816 RepID=A0A9D1IDN5_9FIRM|nr:cytidine deaminase [Candidatus Fimenecus excrementigallinarum]